MSEAGQAALMANQAAAQAIEGLIGELPAVPVGPGSPAAAPAPPPPEEDKPWWSDAGHVVLDGIGLVPGFGEPADGINALWYLAEGDKLNAGLSATGMAPFLGWGATGTKWGIKGAKAADEVVGATGRVADDMVPTRPSWRQSETDVYDRHRQQGYAEQQSFKDGEPVPYGTRGSSRPELYKAGSSIEVKNYDVASSHGRSNLVRSIVNQVGTRGRNLPDGTAQQVVIDVRGQSASPETLDALADRIGRRTGGQVGPESITFLR